MSKWVCWGFQFLCTGNNCFAAPQAGSPFCVDCVTWRGRHHSCCSCIWRPVATKTRRTSCTTEFWWPWQCGLVKGQTTQHHGDCCSRERKAVDREPKRGRGDLICLFFSSQWLSKKRMSKLNFDILIESTCSACPQQLRSEGCSLLGYWFHTSVFVFILLQISARVVLLPCLLLFY